MDKEKYIDEAWKESAAKDKERLEKIAKQKETVEKDEKPIEENLQEPKANQASVDSRAQEMLDEDSVKQPGAMEINFLNYVTSLGFQTMIFLGEIPNPITNAVEKNLEQAKFLIDTLAMLREKTKGNLTQQESDLLSNSVYELQRKYVDQVQKEVKGNQKDQAT